ncbi:hypothetical protein AGABI2DRAFT_181533 [Agaricus bisporus var. bisporus H97]|uniref:hypothetical protein n=1 Tax=Agaricus bisporus var. bisporus (strain H97 / ATCC MYA-4626 / FGSC 10389) TaxID=936046 RepID=UPI00029F5B88|nr:hypothetical protein AGABI2DRAFT_181533 [Agaricus bisporus var. bisporus H97]EKV41979.1 hypothetical protein AGABI2DRAFT_181533 [Agaricus bisporus var. bisporus H97]
MKLKAHKPQPSPINGHRGSEIATDSALPSIVIVSESSEATEAHRGAMEVGNTRNGALNYAARSPTTSSVHNETHSIGGSEYEAYQVNTIARGGFLNNTHHFVVKDSILVDQSTNVTNHGVGDRAEKAHDSSARDPPPQCHPGTRIKINEKIVAWFYDKMKRELILWIYGPAGVGKSAIVQTFAAKLASAGCLGASVFFSRPNGRNKSDSVFITIAYELALRIEEYAAYIGEKLAFDPRLMKASTKEQFRAFIFEPFAEKKVGAGGKTWGILLDGLDELDKRDRQWEIIQLITTFVRDNPNVPLVWVISSRPEPHIINTFKQRRLSYKFKEEYVPIDSPEACQDLERFLRSRFKVIQQDEFPHIVAKGWPEETKIVKLANAASGLFAFADVAIRFIRDPDLADPTSRLDEVISMVDGRSAVSTDDQPFAQLDALYTHILTRISSKMWRTTQRVLGAVAASMLHDKINCVKGLSVILGLPLSKVYAAINDLYSLLDIPLLVEVYEKQFRYHHASFVDFLRDPARSKKFHISEESAVIDVNKSSIRTWLDFKRNSVPGPSSGYGDRWYEYASQFHSEGHQPVHVLHGFNNGLLGLVHFRVFSSLQDRWSIIQQEGPTHHWDKLLEILCQIDAGTAYSSLGFYQHSFVNLWFDIWKAHRGELTSRGIAREIQLQRLRLDSLETEDGQVVVSITIDREWIDDDYFQKCYPELPVLICGLPGSRYDLKTMLFIVSFCLPPSPLVESVGSEIYKQTKKQQCQKEKK